MTMPGSKISNALENDSHVVSHIHLELRSGHKESYIKIVYDYGAMSIRIAIKKARRGLEYKIVSKIMCSSYGVYTFEGSGKEAFQSCINLDAQKL